MKALNRKVLRDIWSMKGQAFAIALIITSGVSTFVLFLSTIESLTLTNDRYYKDYAFADVFAPLKRAPEGLKERILELPGVEKVETRIVAEVKLEIKGFPEPVTATLVSVPDSGLPALNGLFIKNGRMPDPARGNETLISDAFAEAHRFKPGDSFDAVINGKKKRLIVSGTALSPEYTLQVRPGSINVDYKRYGILWMCRSALSSAYDLSGAFNDVSLSLSSGANAEDVIPSLDNLLGRYGGFGAYSRDDQMSNRYLSEEFRQLKNSAEIYPTIFILVSAFLINIVIARVVSIQREQIATLKAFGYGNLSIGMHYIKLMAFIVMAGIVMGTLSGVWLGKALGRLYMEFYRFPFLTYRLSPAVVFYACLFSVIPVLAGAIRSVYGAASLPPAEGMRPEPPMLYRESMIERLFPPGTFSQPSRIIVRNIGRKPVKAFFTVIGISMACAIMIAGGFFQDAIDYMVDVQFVRSQKEDMTVTFIGPTSGKALHELEGVPGVEHVEGFRSVPVRLSNENLSYRTVIHGVGKENLLSPLLDTELRPVSIAESGIVLTDYLGGLLDIKAGDMLTVEVLEGRRPVRRVPVSAFINQYVGLSAYMDASVLNRLLGEGNAISGVRLTDDGSFRDEIYGKLVGMPRVAGISVREEELRNFYETQAEAILVFMSVATLLAGIIAFGVVYNSARISLSERSRELASLRVLGYTRTEISYILLGELGILTLAAIPIGFLLGGMLCAYIAAALGSDLFRVPLVIERGTYSLAALVVIASAFISGLMVRRRLDRLDLIGVLKTRE